MIVRRRFTHSVCACQRKKRSSAIDFPFLAWPITGRSRTKREIKSPNHHPSELDCRADHRTRLVKSRIIGTPMISPSDSLFGCIKPRVRYGMFRRAEISQWGRRFILPTTPEARSISKAGHRDGGRWRYGEGVSTTSLFASPNLVHRGDSHTEHCRSIREGGSASCV